jgi:penicillin-binding protein 2
LEFLKSKLEKIMEILENRELVLSFILCIIALVFLIQLFNLQVINGVSYREQAENKIVRTESIAASRGEIYDRNGVLLATNRLTYDVEIYRTKVGVEKTNEAIIKLVDIIERNGDKIYSTFPCNASGDNFSEEYLNNAELRNSFLKNIKLDENATYQDVLNYYSKKYAVEDYDFRDKINVIKVKYEANLNGYSLFNGVVISKDISKNSVAQIEELKSELYGVNIISVPQRYYASDYFACHIIGYVSKINTDEYNNSKDEGYTINSMIGKSGIEESMEKYLKGVDGVKKVVTDSLGNVSSEQIITEASSGKDVTLTIDYRIQNVVENALKNTLWNLQTGGYGKEPIYEAQSGSCVVLDVETGEVLAIASYPEYNINSFVDGISSSEWNSLISDAQKPMFNRAISGTYSPGSTYKMLMGIAGLESGGIYVDEYYTDPGEYPYAYKPKCWIYTAHQITHGAINLAGALKGSCNCYFYEVGRRIGIANIVEWAKNFGLGSKTGIELSGEAKGNIAGDGVNEWSLGDTLSASIGQNTNLFTPIQLANYISTIANGGTLNKVSLIKNVGDDINSVPLSELANYTKEFTGVDFQPRNLDIDPSYINAIKEGMYAVTTENGGTAADIFADSRVEVAGKTGTAQVASGANNAIFVGFAPYNNPKIAVVAIVEHGGEGYYLANMVKEITNEYFDIYNFDGEKQKIQEVVNVGVDF